MNEDLSLTRIVNEDFAKLSKVITFDYSLFNEHFYFCLFFAYFLPIFAHDFVLLGKNGLIFDCIYSLSGNIKWSTSG